MKLRYMKNFESKLQAQKIRWNSPKVSPAACENWYQFLLFKTLAHIRFQTNADLLISYQQEHNSYKDREHIPTKGSPKFVLSIYLLMI